MGRGTRTGLSKRQLMPRRYPSLYECRLCGGTGELGEHECPDCRGVRYIPDGEIRAQQLKIERNPK